MTIQGESLTWVEVSRSPDRRTCQAHGLVLQAMGLPHGILENGGAYVVVTRVEVAQQARDEIERYDRENQNWPPRERLVAPISQGIHAAIRYAQALSRSKNR